MKPSLPILLALILFTATAGHTASAPLRPAAASPLDRPIRLSLWAAGLNDFAREVKSQTGLDVLFYLADLPQTENTDNLYLVTGLVPLAAVLDALAYQYHFRYRLSDTGQIELAKSYAWTGAAQSLKIIRLKPLVNHDPKPEATRQFLLELLKPLALLPGDFSLEVESYPLPNQPQNLRLTAVLPPVLANYLTRAIRCLQGEGGDYPPNPMRPKENNLFARARALPGDWGNLLGRQVTTPKATGLREILMEVAEQAGVALLLDLPPKRENGEKLPADIERYSLARLTEALAKNWGLGGRVFLAGGGVVFERGRSGDYEIDGRGREAYWDGLAVAGFQIGGLVERAGGIDLVLGILRREVFPGLWRDAVCSMLYCGATGRLVVVAPENAVAGVGERLRALWGTGEK